VTRALTSGLVALVAALWLTAGTVAPDEASEAFRPCKRSDLIGTWAVIRFGTAPSARVDPADPYFHPYQRYVFRPDASLRHLTSPAPLTPEDLRAMLAAPATATWAVDDRGWLSTQRSGLPGRALDACQVLVVKVVDARSRIPGLPGDLLLTHYDENANPIARRLLRKLRD